MDITLTPELEQAVTQQAALQGMTPELLVLHDLLALYTSTRQEMPSRPDGQADGLILADFLAKKTGRTDSREYNGGQPSRLSSDEDSFGASLEEKRRQGRL